MTLSEFRRAYPEFDDLPDSAILKYFPEMVGGTGGSGQTQQQGGDGQLMSPDSISSFTDLFSFGGGGPSGTETNVGALNEIESGALSSGNAVAGSESSSSLGGAAGYLAYILAAIKGQHMAKDATDRRFEGQKTKDAFGGSGATEPWLALLYQKMGVDAPTTGESVDAAVQNKDWGLAASRLPEHAAYYFDPVRSGVSDLAKDKLGKRWGGAVGNLIAPERFIGGKLGKWVKSLF